MEKSCSNMICLKKLLTKLKVKKMNRIKAWKIQITAGILIILVSIPFFLQNQVHTGLGIFGIGLIPIALTLVSPFSAMQAMKQSKTKQEIEKIDLEWEI